MIHEVAPRRAKVARALHCTTVAAWRPAAAPLPTGAGGRHLRGHDEALGRLGQVQLYRTRQLAGTLHLAMVHEVAPRRAKVARALHA